MRFATSVLGALPPEFAHRAAIRALAVYPLRVPADKDTRLRVETFGLSFPNPLGLAAGFDKNAEAVDGLFRLGFGFVEVGTLTPRRQEGNPGPRLFRLQEDAAIVNRLGFNNEGYTAAEARLIAARHSGVVGVNIGPNKDSGDRIADYVLGIRKFSSVAGYFTINISSPNTPGLRGLHARDEFAALADAVLSARDEAPIRRPVLVKISPDLSENELDELITVAQERRFDGLIVSNTSIGRPDSLRAVGAKEAGGLSGRPIFSHSTRLVARCFQRCGAFLPIIGVGGIENAETALAKIEAGACLIQVYTGLTYRGPQLVQEVLRGFGAELSRRGVASISALVGLRSAEIARE